MSHTFRGKNSTFDKYKKKAAYHWIEADHSNFSSFNPLLLGRYQAVLSLCEGKKGRVLEVGTGDGFLLGQYSQNFHPFRMIGIDRSFEGVKLAQEQFFRLNLAGEFLVCDSSHIPFPDQQFDLIFLADVIEHLPNARATLAEIFRLLRSDGLLVLSTPIKQAGKRWDKLHAHEFSSPELKLLLKEYFTRNEFWFCWPRKWFHLWKTHRLFRMLIKLMSRFLHNPFSLLYPATLSETRFGQMVVQCHKGEPCA